ncbi:hypothetical protein VMT65_05675 [Nocardia sp. CDC153]|uniref:hypothetical protein n=1 Tax=Nocardia sp. CDC153 TaxID=3112167 RepID=UPI002DBFE24D|nr:hypothetical protein [Nocardia sp. CDC153]MEC3952514.1 hypothetical protein [Nocardia sp. CDC153]
MNQPNLHRSPESRETQVAPGVYLPIPSLLSVPDHPEPGFETKIEILFDGAKVYPAQVAVESLQPGRAVTGTELRAVRVAGLIAEHLPDHAHNALGANLMTRDPAEVTEIREAGIRDGRALEFVASSYQVASALGLPPAKYVQERLGLTRPTATRWIRQVREMGWLHDGPMKDEEQQAVSDGDD